MTATLLEPPARAAALLRDNPVNDLRHLEITETDSEIIVSGIVSSYYLKQMAQETVRPALAGRKLRNRVIVLPRLGTLHTGRLRRWLMQSARPDERVRRNRRRLSQEVEFHGLRQFRPGDSPRWIHWRTSARSGELMVREFDQGVHHDLVLFVEPYLASGDSNRDALEAALSLAATICWAWCREGGDRVTLGDSQLVVTGDG